MLEIILIFSAVAAVIVAASAVFFFKKKAKLGSTEQQKSIKSLLGQKLDQLIQSTKQIDPKFLESLEELLYTSDLGPKTVEKLLDQVTQKLSRGELKEPQKIKDVIAELIGQILNKEASLEIKTQPHVILIVGVNGVGKTTSIGKLAHYWNKAGKKIMVVAADTFRAAAGGQLHVWANRAGVDIYTTSQTQDPGAVAYQGLEKAIKEKSDIVIIDTAGRLHTKENLMEELKKVKRVIQKLIPEAPHAVLLVIDANSGQNALVQAKQFNEAVGLTGLIVTKLDGSAKGGVIVGIAAETGVVPAFVGVGEKMEDLQIFSAPQFARSLVL